MEQKKTFFLLVFLLTMLACNSFAMPDTSSTPARIEATTPPATPTTPTALSENEATCRAEIIITSVDEVDLGDGTKLVHVKIGFENHGTLWAKLRGPDDDEDTETQKSVFITTEDGSVYGFLGRPQGIPAQLLPDPNRTRYEERGAVVTALMPPEFAILGQTVGGKPHPYGFAFLMPSTQIPASIEIRNMSLWCIGPPTVDRYSSDPLVETYSLTSGFRDVDSLPSADRFPNLIGSKLEIEYAGQIIEFTGVTRDGDTVTILFNYTNNSSYDANPSFAGYIIGNGRFASCVTGTSIDCEDASTSVPAVPPGQTGHGSASFIVPEGETNLFFAYVEGDVGELNRIYRIDVADISQAGVP